MTNSEKSGVDATVTKPQATLQPTSYFDIEKSRGSSEQITPTVEVTPAADNEYDPTTHTKPYSPFYIHPSERQSMDQSKRTINVQVRESEDLESGLTIQKSATTVGKTSDTGTLKEWSSARLPFGKQPCGKGKTWPKQKKFNFLANLSRGQRLAVKLVIALLIVGAMVGLAVGITVAVHGGVYKSPNQSTPIQS